MMVIKLTSEFDRIPVFVLAGNILQWRPALVLGRDRKGSSIQLPGNEWVDVLETPEEIAEMMGGQTQNEKVAATLEEIARNTRCRHA